MTEGVGQLLSNYHYPCIVPSTPMIYLPLLSKPLQDISDISQKPLLAQVNAPPNPAVS